MGIGIAAEKKYLEKQKTSGPYRRRTTEPGKEIFSNQQLNLEEKESANEDCYSDSVSVRKSGAFLMHGRGHSAVFWDRHVRQFVMNLTRQVNPRLQSFEPQSISKSYATCSHFHESDGDLWYQTVTIWINRIVKRNGVAEHR